MSYYHQYFNSGTNWYENKSSKNWFSIWINITFHEEDLFTEYENEANKQKNYYDILGIPFDAKSDEIKEAFQNWQLNITLIKT